MFVFFIVVGAGAYAVMATASAPPVEVEGPVTADEGSSFQLDGQQYNVGEIALTESSGGGHGGGGGAHLATTLNYTVQNANNTAEIAAEDELAFRGGTYVATFNNSSTGQGKDLVLTEQFNVTARLSEDPDVYDEPITVNDTDHVRYRNNTIQPLDEYLPEPDVQRLSRGDTFTYTAGEGEEAEEVQATVNSIGEESATVSWTAPKTTEKEVDDGANVTLANDETYLVHFPDDGQLVLSQNFQAYAAEQNEQDVYHERLNGLWAVVIIAFLAAIFVLGLAYMPVRG